MFKNNQTGLRKTILYLMPPFWLGLCGPDNKEESIALFEDYLKEPERAKEEKIRKIIEQFNFFKHYRKIALANKKEPFSPEVITAYWLGNNLLDPFFNQWTKNLPSHFYLVLTAETLKTGDAFTARAKDLCRINWGLVKELKVGKIAVECLSLEQKGNSWGLGSPVIREVSWDKNIFPELKEGETVATHWGTAVDVLNEEEARDIIKYTQKVFSLF